MLDSYVASGPVAGTAGALVPLLVALRLVPNAFPPPDSMLDRTVASGPVAGTAGALVLLLGALRLVYHY